MNRYSSIAVFVLLTLSGLVSTSCTSHSKKVEATAPATAKATVLRAERAVVPQDLEATGTVRAAETAQIAAQIVGTVTGITVREGDSVRRGQLLLTISDEQLRAGVDRAGAAVNAANHEAVAAESERELAETTMKRYQAMYDKKALSPQEFDEVRARLRAATAKSEMARAGQVQAKAALHEASSAAGYARIRAPFDGVVTERRVDPGALAAPGVPLLTVESRGKYRLEASVDEANLRAVRVGQVVPVLVDALGTESFNGKVVQVLPAADAASRSFVVKVELPSNAAIRSGLFGRAHFQLGEKNAIVVPRSAVIDRGQLQAVIVVGKDSLAFIRYITLGQAFGDKVEVLSGLTGDEVIVSAPGNQEWAGKRIEVQR